MWTVITDNPAQTRNLGYKLGREISAPALIALSGELGSGKTCLAQGILCGIGITETYLTSPSYVLVQEYRAKLTGTAVYHMDLYRLENPRQTEDLGYEEYFGSSAIGIIEWAERIENLLPDTYLKINIIATGHLERKIEFIPHGQRYEELTSRVLSHE